MLDAALWQSLLGAVVGFALAQLANFGKISWNWWWRPRLRIESASENLEVLSHKTSTADSGWLDEKAFGFDVQNCGRSLATNVRSQLLKIEARDRDQSEFSVVFSGAAPLRLYSNVGRRDGSLVATIVPQARVIVALAEWRDDHVGVVFPATESWPDYYEEFCEGAVEYRFRVVAFSDDSHYVSETLLLQPK